MSLHPNRVELPAELAAWVEGATGAALVWAVPHLEGASRSAWRLEVEGAAGRRRLFLLRDKGAGGGSARDAAVLRALADTPVPVPEVIEASEEHAAVLVEQLAGRADFPAVDEESERESTARHLMELTAVLHGLDVERLRIPHLEPPKVPEDCARPAIDGSREALRALGAAADPFFGFALDWLAANVPGDVARHALVHSDMGPGNFLYARGRVTGIVDWEVAHFGDPMEDLAALSVRDMATPVGSLAARLAEYAASSGRPVDLGRIHYYRALILVRNSLMIGLGLAHPTPDFDTGRMTRYQTLLARAATLVLCDNLGLERPDAQTSLPVQHFDTAHDAAGALDECERREIGELLTAHPGRLPHELTALDERLRAALPPSGEPSPARDAACRYFARRWHRIAFRQRALLGPLYERLPQPLEAP